jgi:hypothetical protein
VLFRLIPAVLHTFSLTFAVPYCSPDIEAVLATGRPAPDAGSGH